jgi:hypothetical protein
MAPGKELLVMPLGRTSLEQLATCHPEIQSLVKDASAGIDAGDLAYAGIHDMTVSCGHRGQADQEAAFAAGTSEVHWPHGAHNRTPSDAADVEPYPERWSDPDKLAALHAYIAGLARGRGMKLKGISWDAPHIERVP